jgi:hypothetical protein
MKKLLKYGLIILVILAVVIIFYAGQVVENAINTTGPAALGVPVSVEKVRAYPLRGIVRIKGLVVGNPEGFKTDNLFSMGVLNIDLSARSLLTDKIIIHKIEVVAPEITYEVKLNGSNIGALQESLGGDKNNDAEKETEEEAAKEDKSGGKKVVIEQVVISDGKINLSLPGMMGTAVPLPLPTIELKDIGKEKEGASPTEVIAKIVHAVLNSVTQVVKSSGKLLGDGAKAVGQGAAAVGGAAVDGASAVGGAAVDAGKAVGKGVANVVGGVADIFGGSDKKDE